MLSNKKRLISDFRLAKVRLKKLCHCIHGSHFFAVLNESTEPLLRLSKFIPPGEGGADDYLSARLRDVTEPGQHFSWMCHSIKQIGHYDDVEFTQ